MRKVHIRTPGKYVIFLAWFLNNFIQFSFNCMCSAMLCIETVFGRSSAPNSAGGAYDAPPDPPVGWGGVAHSHPSTPSTSRSGRLHSTNFRLRNYMLCTPCQKILARPLAESPSRCPQQFNNAWYAEPDILQQNSVVHCKIHLKNAFQA